MIQATTKDAYNLLHKGSIALAAVESAGIRIDTEYLNKTINENEIRIKELEDDLKQDPIWGSWKKTWGEQKANLGSLTQLAKVLFEVEQIPYDPEWGTTPTGRYRADDEIFAKVGVPFTEKLTKIRKLSHMTNTFLKGIRREVVDGLLHPDLNLHTARSYRSSSGGGDETTGGRSFNTQNITSRDVEFAKMIRRCFIPRNGNRLIESDFSAHEFRISAIIRGDPLMLKYASDPTKDIHRDMAMKCFLIDDPKLVGKDCRYVGKNGFVFPKLYGSYWKKIAAAMWLEIEAKKLKVGDVPMKKHLRLKGISELGNSDGQPLPGTFEHHIKKVETEFLQKFHVFASRCDEVWQEYRNTGEFSMVTGFLCKGIYSKNARLNYDTQGPAFHCLLWCIIELVKEIRKRKMKAKVVNQVHDCVIGDVPNEETQEYLYLLKDIVEVRLRKAWEWISIPLAVEAEVCGVEDDWSLKKQWIEKDGLWQLPPKAA